MPIFVTEILQSFRSLLKSPGFASVAVLVLALGIGADTAIFSVVNSVLFNALPYPNANRLALIWETDLKDGIRIEGPSGPNYLDWKEQSHSFEEMALLEVGTGTLTGDGEPQQVTGLRVTTNFLPMLGAHIALGRSFETAEGAGKGRYPVAVLTNGFWRSHFGSDPNVVGRSFTLNSEPYTVIGVLAPDFFQPLPCDLFVPWPLAELRSKGRASHDFGVIGRLRPNVTWAQAQRELGGIARRIDAATPALAGWDVTIVPMKQALFESIRPAFIALLGAVGLLLLLACVNMASLLLARITSKAKEIGIRTALGASRSRLVQHVLSESLILSLLGGLFGVFLASWGVNLLSSILPATLPLPDAGAEIMRPDINIDARVLIFTLVISFASSLIFGLIPALHAARTNVNDALKAGGRTSSESVSRMSVWRWLVVCEIALASMLLVVAGLTMKSFVNLQHVDSGIQPDHVLTFRMRLPTDNLYKQGFEQALFYRRVLDRVQQISGVQSAGLTDVLPLGQQNGTEYFSIENRPLPPHQTLAADFRRVSAGYLHTMGVSLLQGRMLSDHDVNDSAPVVLIDEAFAHQYWPNQNPLERRIRVWGVYRQIVGVVRQVHHYGLDKQPEPTIYAPFEQMPNKSMALVIRTTVDTQTMIRSVKQAIYSVDPGQPVFLIRTMNDYLSLAETAPRISTILLSAFAVISMLLTAMGVHGVVSYGVSQRTREFGLRMALGSSSRQIKTDVVKAGLKTALLGLVIGMAGAVALASALRTFLFGVMPLDPLVVSATSLLLLGVVFLANYIPALRATRTDPIVALRCDG